MIDVIENLKQEINNHEKIKNSVLGKTHKWRNNHFEILSSIINEELSKKIDQNNENFFTLGNTISHITLKRIFEGQVNDSAHNDLRFLKTLEKIAIFLNYQNLNHFISELQKSPRTVFDITEKEFQDYKKLIKTCCECEFSNMKNIPDIDMSLFRDVLIENSPYQNRIEMYLNKIKETGSKMVVEISNFEIYNYKLVSIDEEMMVISSQEFWNLVFEKNGEHIPFHRKGEQNYYLKRDSQDTWKIWDNYNPDYKDMINPKKNRN